VSSEVPLYQRDPEAWQAYLAEGNRTQPRKRVSADVLFRDESGQILLVDPRYKPDWDLPGGMAEANEAPLDAARREVGEELGIEYAGGRLLAIDWVAPHGPWDDSLAFVFDGGILTGADRDRIRLVTGNSTSTGSFRSTMLPGCCGRTSKVGSGKPRRSRWRRLAISAQRCARLTDSPSQRPHGRPVSSREV
jgi:8-oxo-dGTP diphosphatase